MCVGASVCLEEMDAQLLVCLKAERWPRRVFAELPLSHAKPTFTYSHDSLHLVFFARGQVDVACDSGCVSNWLMNA